MAIDILDRIKNPQNYNIPLAKTPRGRFVGGAFMQPWELQEAQAPLQQNALLLAMGGQPAHGTQHPQPQQHHNRIEEDYSGPLGVMPSSLIRGSIYGGFGQSQGNMGFLNPFSLPGF